MFARIKILALLGIASLLAAAPVSAMQAANSATEAPDTSLQPPAAAPTIPKRDKTDKTDLNDRHCETITVPGSRLAKKRVCGTRAEWRDHQLQDRQATEKIQVGPCVRGAGC